MAFHSQRGAAPQLSERRGAVSSLALAAGAIVMVCAIWVGSRAYRMLVHAGDASSTSDSPARGAASPAAASVPQVRPTVAATSRPRRANPPGTEAGCYAELRAAGVTFRAVPEAKAPGVAWPIELTSALDGVLIRGAKKNAPTNYLDCRLARALLAWAPSLRAQGVVALQHMSAYRRDAVVAGTTVQSGHALGQAIDIGRFELRDGRKLSVLEDWTNRARGADPCGAWLTDSDAARIMRKLVCDAVERDVFQIALTPHYNDAHGNHVHLELRAQADTAWVN